MKQTERTSTRRLTRRATTSTRRLTRRAALGALGGSLEMMMMMLIARLMAKVGCELKATPTSEMSTARSTMHPSSRYCFIQIHTYDPFIATRVCHEQMIHSFRVIGITHSFAIHLEL